MKSKGVQDDIDVYFATFAKSMASTGAFIAGDSEIIEYLKYNMRSQMFAKSLQMQLVVGAIKRLEMIQKDTKLKDKLWDNVNLLQKALKIEDLILETLKVVLHLYILKVVSLKQWF